MQINLASPDEILEIKLDQKNLVEKIDLCFECFSNIVRKNKGRISNAKHEQQRRIPENPSLAEPMNGLLMATCFDWPTGTDTCVRVVGHLVKNTLEPKLYL